MLQLHPQVFKVDELLFSVEQKMARDVVTWWQSFAAIGTPGTAPSGQAWPAFTADAANVLVWNAEKDRCAGAICCRADCLLPSFLFAPLLSKACFGGCQQCADWTASNPQQAKLHGDDGAQAGGLRLLGEPRAAQPVHLGQVRVQRYGMMPSLQPLNSRSKGRKGRDGEKKGRCNGYEE